MALTGLKRSLTLVVSRKISGEMAPGYPRTYYGQQAFDWDNKSYPSLSPEEFSLLSTNSYEERKEAFQAYVESQEYGLHIESVQTNQPTFYHDL